MKRDYGGLVPEWLSARKYDDLVVGDCLLCPRRNDRD